MARPRSINRLTSFTLLVLPAFIPASLASPDAPAASPSEGGIICHTENPSECYPKIFQATDEFQKVHDDQDLPAGLHVRLNVFTGLKEAKINIPGDEQPVLDGLPDGKSIVAVDPDESEKPPVPPNAPTYDPHGSVKKKPEDEPSAFYKSLAILKKGLDIDQALEMLEDISHDIYYGLKIAEDYDTIHQLFCLANTEAVFAADAEEAVLRRARLASLTIASAVQNNPKALVEIQRHWATLRKKTCSQSSETLGTATFRLVSNPANGRARNDAGLTKVRVSAISGLLKNDAIRKAFLASGGMDLLLQVLAIGEKGDWEPARRKVGLLVIDNFLDGDMGASLGEWPTDDQLEDGKCAEREDVSGQCWDWYVKQLVKQSEKGHWSRELLAKLKEQRKANAGTTKARVKEL